MKKLILEKLPLLSILADDDFTIGCCKKCPIQDCCEYLWWECPLEVECEISEEEKE